MGAGRSITGAFFGKGTSVLQLQEDAPHVELDQEAHCVRVSASATVAHVYNFLIKRGYVLTGLPSYPGVTIGGCIAGNVHGQNHYREGCFGKNVISLSLAHPDLGLRTVSRENEQRLFNLTVGGFGLTGVITEATIKVVPITTDILEVSVRRFNSIAEGYQMMMLDKDETDYFHSWVDLTSLSSRGERGFVFRGIFSKKHEIRGIAVKHERQRRSHLPWKPNIFSGPVLKWVNEYYFRSNTRCIQKTIGIPKFVFPSNSRLWYFSMFGKTGLIEHQVLIPHEAVNSYLIELKRILLKKSPFISLCHLKLFKGNTNLLNFDGSGLCLAMHLRADQCSFEVLNRLDGINIEHGCITNIIKDSRVEPDILRRQYSGYDEFVTGIINYDQELTFQNIISQRLFSKT
jgi:FAD/FMN-containing dehydrogenase